MRPFNIFDWYWIVGGDATKVYSSKVGDYVPSTDPTFVAWQDNNGDPTPPTVIDSEINLGIVLATAQARPQVAGVLDGYTSQLADDAVKIVCFKIEFNHENRIRALEGRPTISVQQFRNAIKALQ